MAHIQNQQMTQCYFRGKAVTCVGHSVASRTLSLCLSVCTGMCLKRKIVELSTPKVVRDIVHKNVLSNHKVKVRLRFGVRVMMGERRGSPCRYNCICSNFGMVARHHLHNISVYMNLNPSYGCCAMLQC